MKKACYARGMPRDKLFGRKALFNGWTLDEMRHRLGRVLVRERRKRHDAIMDAFERRQRVIESGGSVYTCGRGDRGALGIRSYTVRGDDNNNPILS